MRMSIIIPTRGQNPYLIENLSRSSRLDYEDYEVIVLSDEPLDLAFPRTRIVVTGRLSPPSKRNLGVQLATGEVVAFLDDDAFPRTDWLRCSSQILSNTSAGAVCGPAISAPSTDRMEIAASAVIESPLVSGPVRYRFVRSQSRVVDDFPACNLIVRKSVFQEVGGFDPKLYPGEDTKLCLDITHRLGRKIIYHPDVMVYHHRRPLFVAHLAQIASYACSRGYFARVYPKTSRRISYFVPSLFLLGCVFTALVAVWLMPVRVMMVFSPVCYIGTVMTVEKLHKSGVSIWRACLGIVLTHMCYGFYFLWGMLTLRHPSMTHSHPAKGGLSGKSPGWPKGRSRTRSEDCDKRRGELQRSQV